MQQFTYINKYDTVHLTVTVTNLLLEIFTWIHDQVQLRQIFLGRD